MYSSWLPAPVAWRSLDVQLPKYEWQQLIDDMDIEASSSQYPNINQSGRNQGSSGSGVCFQVATQTCMLQVYLVETEEALRPALDALSKSMRDDLIAVDLEWNGRSNGPIALMQLASSDDPSITIVGMSWHINDERKMVSTFGVGRSLFKNFVDAATVAKELGYEECGLAALAESVLGVTLSKPKEITLSNWAAPRLSMRQVLYAAQDALICCGIIRQLVMLHGHGATRAAYSVRHRRGASSVQSLQYTCPECHRTFGNSAAYAQHICDTRHAPPDLSLGRDQTPGSDTTYREYVPDSGNTSPVPCPACQRVFRSAQSMAQHMRSTGHREMIACPQCQRLFGGIGARNQHMRDTGHGYEVACPQCPRLFGSIGARDQHVRDTGHGGWY